MSGRNNYQPTDRGLNSGTGRFKTLEEVDDGSDYFNSLPAGDSRQSVNLRQTSNSRQTSSSRQLSNSWQSGDSLPPSLPPRTNPRTPYSVEEHQSTSIRTNSRSDPATDSSTLGSLDLHSVLDGSIKTDESHSFKSNGDYERGVHGSMGQGLPLVAELSELKLVTHPIPGEPTTSAYYNIASYRRTQSESQISDSMPSFYIDSGTMGPNQATMYQGKTTVAPSPPSPAPRKSRLSQGSSNSLSDGSQSHHSGTGGSSTTGSGETTGSSPIYTNMQRVPGHSGDAGDAAPSVRQSPNTGGTPYTSTSGNISNKAARSSPDYLPMDLTGGSGAKSDTTVGGDNPVPTTTRRIAPLQPGPSVRPKQKAGAYQNVPFKRPRSPTPPPPQPPTPPPSGPAPEPDSDYLTPVHRSGSSPAAMGGITEEEATNQYRLCYQRASVKEKSEKYEDALADYELALYYEIQARGEYHIEIAKTQRVVGRLCRRLSKSPEAVSHLKRGLDICNKCDNVDSDILWGIHDELAQAYAAIDLPKESEHYEAAINILVMSTDVPPERLAHMHNNVGVCYHKLEKWNEARKHLELAKEMMMLMYLGEANEDLAKVHKGLGDLYKDIDQHSQAIEEFESCLTIYSQTSDAAARRKLCEPVHEALAELYQQTNNTVKARQHREATASPETSKELLAVTPNKTGVGERCGESRAAQLDADKAQQYQAEYDFKRAIMNYEMAIDKMKSLPAPLLNTEQNLSQVAMMHNNCGNAYRSVSRTEDAKIHLKHALAIRRRLYADGACEPTATTLFNLGFIYAQLGGPANLLESVKLHKEALNMYNRLGGPSKFLVQVFNAMQSHISPYFH